MNNQLLIPDDKIYIYPSDWKQPVQIQFEKWVDYNTMVTDETLQKFIKDYVSKNFPVEHTVSIYHECVCESLL
jgi:hypothetical protein